MMRSPFLPMMPRGHASSRLMTAFAIVFVFLVVLRLVLLVMRLAFGALMLVCLLLLVRTCRGSVVLSMVVVGTILFSSLGLLVILVALVWLISWWILVIRVRFVLSVVRLCVMSVV